MFKYKFLEHFPMIESEYQENISEVPIMLAISATSISMMAYRFYKDYMTKAARECGTLQGRDKNLCMLKYRINALETKKSKLEKGLRKCKEAKNPEKCEEKVKKDIKKTEERLKKVKKQFDMLYKIVKQEEEKERKK